MNKYSDYVVKKDRHFQLNGNYNFKKDTVGFDGNGLFEVLLSLVSSYDQVDLNDFEIITPQEIVAEGKVVKFVDLSPFYRMQVEGEVRRLAKLYLKGYFLDEEK